MKNVDANNNGVIDFSEFLMAHLSYKNMQNTEMLRSAFDEFDLDKNGVITLKEV